MAEYTQLKERIALGKKGQKEEAKRRKAAIAEQIDDAEEDEDVEMKEWENAQARRGGLASEAHSPGPEDLTYKARPIPNITQLPSLITGISRLSGTLSNLQTAHTAHESSLQAVYSERSDLESKEQEMREVVSIAEMKRAWMSDFHEWMETVATFLDEKGCAFPALEKLEDEHVSLLAERYDMIAKRRRDDDEDDLSLFLYLPLVRPNASEDETDEYGRSVESRPEGPHSSSRESRRASRAARRSAIHPSSVSAPYKLALSTEDELGYITDSALLPSDLEDYTLAREKLAHKVSTLLEDVRSDEFRDPRAGYGLAKRFSEWREKFSDSYTGAWGGLGLVGAWEFWARLEIVDWNPLEESRTLDTYNWYSGLYEYSRPSSTANSAMEIDGLPREADLGPDGDLAASMVTTAVIPRLCRILAGGGVDPYSAKHMKRAIDLVEQVELTVDHRDAKFQLFAKALLVPFQRAVEESHELIEPALDPSNPPPPFEPNSVQARRRFLVRRIKLLANLLYWRKAVGAVTGLDDLVRRILLQVMLPVAHGGWDVGGQELMSKAKSLLPRELAKQEWTRPLQ